LIKLGREERIKLGNIQAKRDWGHARDYVRAMWLMLQQGHPDDYVVASGTCHTVAEFLEKAFSLVELDYRNHLEIDPNLYRPSEVMTLRGNSAKAKRVLKWEPTVTFEELIREMVEGDLELLK